MYLLGLMMRGALFTPKSDDLLTAVIYYGGFLGNVMSGILYFLTVWLGYAQADVAGHVHDYGAKFLVGGGIAERARHGGRLRNRDAAKGLENSACRKSASPISKRRILFALFTSIVLGRGDQAHGPRAHALRRVLFRLVRRRHLRLELADVPGTRVTLLDLEKTLLRKTGEAVARFKMIRDGDRVAVALSGGKDSLTLLEVLLRLQQRAPVEFTVCAFTVEQGKFLRPFEPMGEYLKARGSRLDLSSRQSVAAPAGRTARSRLRLVQPLPPPRGVRNCARPGRQRRSPSATRPTISANPSCAMRCLPGAISALPAVTWSGKRDFRLIRPLVFVTEDLTQRVRRIPGRAGDSVRLLAAGRHGAALAARLDWRTGEGLSRA